MKTPSTHLSFQKLRLATLYSFIILPVLLFFPFVTFAQRSSGSNEIVLFAECLKIVGNGRFEITFGYENKFNKDITVAENASFITYSGSKLKGTPVRNFKKGRQTNAFTAEFDGSKITWTILQPNGKQVTVTTDGNASPCAPLTGSVLPYYTPPANGKEDCNICPELSSFFNTSNPASNDIFQLSPDKADVLIEVIALQGKYAELLVKLRQLGLKEEVYNGENSLIITGFFPKINMPALNNDPAVAGDIGELINYARPVYKPVTQGGATTTQGDKAQLSDAARVAFAVQGEGVKLGVLSDSYNTLRQAHIDVANGDLPGVGNPLNPIPVEVLKERRNSILSDEGRAMFQIIHDVAPKAALSFRTGFISAGDFAQGIKELRDAGSQIIVDDITYITEPFLQDGIVAQAVDQVTAEGVAYFSAAGNYGNKSYTRPFTAAPAPSRITGYAHNFSGTGTADIFQRVTLRPGNYTLVLQWDDPFYSMGQGGAANDLDIYLTPDNGTTLLGYNRNNTGGDPLEILPFTVSGGDAQTSIMVVNATGTAPVNFKYVVFRGDFSMNEYMDAGTGSATIVGQANAAGAIAVGAVRYINTPAFGGTLSSASFSSTGGTPILRNISGIPVTGLSLRQKPDVMAPNGVNTTVKLSDEDPEGDGFFNFFGTSAAAPHAAAVAALLMEAHQKFRGHTLTPAQIREKLQQTALDMELSLNLSAGSKFDYKSGYGFIQADAVMATFATPAPLLSQLGIPAGVVPGAQPFIASVKGKYFTSASKIYFNGAELPTTFVSQTELTANIGIFSGNPPVQVYTPPSANGNDGGFSNSLYFIPKTVITIKANNFIDGDANLVDNAKKYGSHLPAFKATVSSTPDALTELLSPSNILLTTPATSLSDVGRYIIQPGFKLQPDAAIADSYEFIFENGLLEIKKIPITVQPNNLTLTYGDAITGITFKYLYDDSHIAAGDRTAILESIQQTHTATFVDATAMVDATAFVDATALVDAFLLLGYSLTEATAMVDGYLYESLVNRSFMASATAMVDATAFVDATAIIDATALVDATAYVDATALVDATAIVDATAMVDATAFVDATAMVDGTMLVNATAMVDNANVNENTNAGMKIILAQGDRVVDELYSVNLVSSIRAGESWIAPGAFLSNNFTITYQLGKLTINKATIKVKADDKTIDFGDPLPAFSSTITGFRRDDTESSVLAGSLSHTLEPATVTSAGTYSIIPGGLEVKPIANYEIEFINGTLYVNPTGANAKAIKPILECVELLTVPENGFYYKVYFAYQNANDTPVSIPVGPNNNLTGSGSFAGTLPTVFYPGGGTFQVLSDGSRLIWTLSSFDGTRKTAVASVASSTSARCKTSVGRIAYADEIPGQVSLIKVYPNPALHQLFIDLGQTNSSTVSITLFDVQGKACLRHDVVNGSDSAIEISTAGLKPGLYLVKIDSGATVEMVKIVKK